MEDHDLSDRKRSMKRMIEADFFPHECRDENRSSASATRPKAEAFLFTARLLSMRPEVFLRGRIVDRMSTLFHLLANCAASLSMKLLFTCVGRVHVLRRQNANHHGGFLLAANHISHFDPPILASVVERKIDWMAMAEFFPRPLLGRFLRAIDAFPADRHHANPATIRTAIERLKEGRIVGLFPEGGIRDGTKSVLEGAPMRLGVSTLAHMAGVPIVPCVIVGSDRFYSKKSWTSLRRTPVWIAFGDPIPHFPDLAKSAARKRIELELVAAFKDLYAELREAFLLTADDLPHPPQQRMNGQNGGTAC